VKPIFIHCKKKPSAGGFHESNCSIPLQKEQKRVWLKKSIVTAKTTVDRWKRGRERKKSSNAWFFNITDLPAKELRSIFSGNA